MRKSTKGPRSLQQEHRKLGRQEAKTRSFLELALASQISWSQTLTVQMSKTRH